MLKDLTRQFCLQQASFAPQLGSYLWSDKTYIVVNSVCTGSNHVILWRWKSKQKAENSVTHLSSDSWPSKPGGQGGHFPHQILTELKAKSLFLIVPQPPKIFRPSVAPVTHLSSVIHHCTYFRYKSPNREQNIIRADGSDFKLQKSCYCYYVWKRKKMVCLPS